MNAEESIRLALGIGLPALISVWQAGAAEAARFPKEVIGTWDLGPEACKLPVNPDSDTPIEIQPQRLLGFESTDTLRRIAQISNAPVAWSVSTESNLALGVGVDEIYVLKGDHLTITDGEAVRSYRRCGEVPSAGLQQCPSAEFGEFLKGFASSQAAALRRQYTREPLAYETPAGVVEEQGAARLNRFKYRYLPEFELYVSEDVATNPVSLDGMRRGVFNAPVSVEAQTSGSYRVTFGMEYESDSYVFERHAGCWQLIRAINLRD
ncbi:hypothetical protein [Stenotrophomonas oahuensis]|uniref:Lipoprotein n=1 Tax=Stenotrophomonas oahuensis TaxID=3003271 RepID=A0ABY9YWI0_9GAMM|nr:hypothetical protein [Stenotrophomonas sp. A5586]WNH54539.1 hypothetical protein PDM29_09770 [Stenotrophomonas sp. A5586]